MGLGKDWGGKEGEEALDVVDDIESGGGVKETMVCADEEDAVL